MGEALVRPRLRERRTRGARKYMVMVLFELDGGASCGGGLRWVL